MSIGSRIKELRIKRGITQEELAQKIGVTKGAIGNYENGVSSPKIELMYKLFDALDCDANYLHQDDMKNSIYKDTATPEEFEKLVNPYRSLDDPGRAHVGTVLDWEAERSSQIRNATDRIKALEQQTATIPIVRAPAPDYLAVNAAHARTDISESEITPELAQLEEAIMDDENF